MQPRRMASISGGSNSIQHSHVNNSLPSSADRRTFSPTIVRHIRVLNYMVMLTLTGPPAHARDDRLRVSAFDLLEVPLHTKQSSNRRLLNHLLKRNSWAHRTLENYYSMCVAFFGISAYRNMQHRFYTRIMMRAQRWQWLRSLHLGLDIWTSSIRSFANGLNETSYI